MSDNLQSIIELLNSGTIKKLLVTSGKNVDPDAVGSMVAMAKALESKVERITMAVEDFDPDSYKAIAGAERIQSTIGQQSLVVSIDISQNPIAKINYHSQDNKFNLVLTPKAGAVDPSSIEYSLTGLDFDATLVVDTAKKSLIGEWINQPAITSLPLINIDHHQDNEQFGTINIIDPTAASATMVIYDLIKQTDIELTADIATPLLIGLLGDTSGFANSNADAKALRFAAELVDAGANLHQSMVGLFRNMSFSAIQLWGRVLSNATKEEPGIIMTQLSQADIVELQPSEADLATTGAIVNNILVADQSAQLAVMLKDKGEGEITGSLRAIADINVADIASQLGGGGHIKAAGFRLYETTLEQAREQVLSVIRQSLPKG